MATATEEKTEQQVAPYGRKKDGSPAKKPGRKPKNTEQKSNTKKPTKKAKSKKSRIETKNPDSLIKTLTRLEQEQEAAKKATEEMLVQLAEDLAQTEDTKKEQKIFKQMRELKKHTHELN
jgi:hypothetical protein